MKKKKKKKSKKKIFIGYKARESQAFHEKMKAKMKSGIDKKGDPDAKELIKAYWPYELI